MIARAGASTVAELACAGRPAILVPLPRAIDDHQTRQCPRAGRGRRGASVMPQAGFTPAALARARWRGCWRPADAGARGRRAPRSAGPAGCGRGAWPISSQALVRAQAAQETR